MAIARALVTQPTLLLADEPTGNLDSKTIVEVMALFQALNEQGITVIIVTHEPDIAQYAHRVIDVRDGRIMKDHAVDGAAPRGGRRTDDGHRARCIDARRSEGGSMKTKSLLTMATGSILKNKMRTLLTMLGIVIGVGAVIVMVAVGNGAQKQIEAQIKNLGTNLIVVTPGSTAAGGASQGAQTFNRLTVADADKIKSDATLLSAVSPVIVTRTQIITGKGNWRTEINGVSTDYLTIRDWGVTSGDLFTDDDVRTKRKVAVLGATIVKNLFPDSDPVGSQIQLGHVPFTVVGVLAAKGQTSSGVGSGRHRARAVHHGAGSPERLHLPRPDPRERELAEGHGGGAGGDSRHHARLARAAGGGAR